MSLSLSLSLSRHSVACPNSCSDHGACINGVCHCDSWWVGPYCGLRDRSKCSKVCAARCVLRTGTDQDETTTGGGPGDRLRQCMQDCMNSDECVRPQYDARSRVSVPPFDIAPPSKTWGNTMDQRAAQARERQEIFNKEHVYGTGGGLASFPNRVR